MGTIYFAQRVMGDFLGFAEKGVAENEIHDTARELMNLSHYLVSNNLILCRAYGWGGQGSLCRWWSDVVPTGTVILRQNQSTCVNRKDALCSCKKLKNNQIEGVKCKKEDFFNAVASAKPPTGTKPVLTFKNRDIIFEGQKQAIQYQMSFDLVKWDDEHVRSLLSADLPYYKQRRLRTMSTPLAGTTPLVPNQTLKEMVSPFDEDHFYVITKVKLFSSREVVQPNDKNQPAGASQSLESSMSLMKETDRGESETHYTGIMRRPKSMMTVSAQDHVRCNINYNSENTANIYPAFRGYHDPKIKNTSLRVKVTNNGPGAVYSLSFFRQKLSDRAEDPVLGHDVGLTQNFLTHFDKWYRAEEVLKKPKHTYTVPKPKMVFMPGETIEYEDVFNSDICKNAGRIHRKIPDWHLSYQLWNLYGWNTNKNNTLPDAGKDIGSFGMGLCLKSDGTVVTLAPPSTPPPSNYVPRPIQCSYKYEKESRKYCKSMAAKANCYYTMLEPRRVFKPILFIKPDFSTSLAIQKKGGGLGAFHVSVRKILPGLKFIY